MGGQLSAWMIPARARTLLARHSVSPHRNRSWRAPMGSSNEHFPPNRACSIDSGMAGNEAWAGIATDGSERPLWCRVSDAGPSQLFARALRAGVRKPQEGTRGPSCAGWRLWGFDRAAAWAGDGLTGVVGGRRTMAAAILSLERWSRGRFWRDRRSAVCLWRRWGDSDAVPEA